MDNIQRYRLKLKGHSVDSVIADSVETVLVPFYVFSKNGKEVRRIPEEDLKEPPVPVPAMSEEDSRAMSDEMRRRASSNYGHTPNL
jgi:hypothetical protein